MHFPSHHTVESNLQYGFHCARGSLLLGCLVLRHREKYQRALLHGRDPPVAPTGSINGALNNFHRAPFSCPSGAPRTASRLPCPSAPRSPPSPGHPDCGAASGCSYHQRPHVEGVLGAGKCFSCFGLFCSVFGVPKVLWGSASQHRIEFAIGDLCCDGNRNTDCIHLNRAQSAHCVPEGTVSSSRISANLTNSFTAA